MNNLISFLREIRSKSTYQGALQQQTQGQFLLQSPGPLCPQDSIGRSDFQGSDRDPEPESNNSTVTVSTDTQTCFYCYLYCNYYFFSFTCQSDLDRLFKIPNLLQLRVMNEN